MLLGVGLGANTVVGAWVNDEGIDGGVKEWIVVNDIIIGVLVGEEGSMRIFAVRKKEKRQKDCTDSCR